MRLILIVEDTNNIALTLALRLKSKDYNVVAADNEASGIELAIKSPPDLMIVDAASLDSDSLATAQKIKDVTADVPTIVVAGDDRVRERAKEIGAAVVFDRASGADQLVAAVEEVMQASVRCAPAEELSTG